MKKGLSTVIEVIMLLMVAVSLTTMVILFAPSANESLLNRTDFGTSYDRSRSCLSIENVSGDYVKIRNCGRTTLKDFKFFVDSDEVGTDFSGEIEPSETILANYVSSLPQKDYYYFYATTDLTESPIIKVNIEDFGIPTSPPVCGNGILETGEQCDGSDLGGQTCISRGFGGGTLSCKSDCTFDTSSCTAPTFSCGDVLCLKFDEGSGNKAYDSSAYSNDGDIYASGRNQVKNPSFEIDKQDWGSGDGTWDIVTDEKYHGEKSSRFQDLTGDSGHERTSSVYIPVSPGQSITVSLYSKGSSIVAGSEPSWHKADLVGKWYDSSYNDIGVYPPYADLIIGDGTGTWNWKRKSMTTIAQTGAAYYRFYLGLLGSSKGTLWVDAVQVEYGNVLTDFTDSAWTSGKFNYGLEFDDVDDYVDCGNDNSLSTTKEMTVAFWIKIASYTPSGSWPNVVGKGNENSNGWRIYQDENSKTLGFAYNDGTSGHWILSSGGELQLNEWYHIAVTFSLSQGIAKMYINGVQYQVSNDIYEIEGNTDSFFIGGGDFNGTIDEVRIYSRALSQAEIQADRDNG